MFLERIHPARGREPQVSANLAITHDPESKSRMIESLRSLLDRLGASGVTLGEAKQLRGELSLMLDAGALDRDRR